MVLEDGKTNLTKLTTSYVPIHKTVTPDTKEEEDTKEHKVTAVKLSNAHKSAGGKVSSNR
jgi:hypothetical protein